MNKLRKKIPRAHDWTGDKLRKERDRENEVAQGTRRLQNAAINVEGVGKRMERVKGNADRKQNIEMRRLIDDADARNEPLEILKEKIPVLEKSEHAQIHAYAPDQPAAARTPLGRRNLSPEPEIHRRCGKQKRGERRVPGAVKKVTGDDEQIFPCRPRTDAPVKRDHDHEKDDESERIKKHGERPKELVCRTEQSIYASHIEGSSIDVALSPC